MKHSKNRLTPRECAASAFIVLAFVGFSIFDADKPLQLVVTLTIAVALLAIGSAILNWPEIKESLQKKTRPAERELGLGAQKITLHIE